MSNIRPMKLGKKKCPGAHQRKSRAREREREREGNSVGEGGATGREIWEENPELLNVCVTGRPSRPLQCGSELMCV